MAMFRRPKFLLYDNCIFNIDQIQCIDVQKVEEKWVLKVYVVGGTNATTAIFNFNTGPEAYSVLHKFHKELGSVLV